MGAVLLCLPFIVLTVFVKLFLSERLPTSGFVPHREPGEPALEAGEV
jgi:hypothetical protein